MKCVNITFEAGKKYLIVGENGSGKSTLFQLLTRFQPDYTGDIYVNSLDLREVDRSFYDRVGIVLQDPFFLNDTLMNNITLYQDYSEEQVRQVLLSLGMERFLEDHPLEQVYQDTKDNLSRAKSRSWLWPGFCCRGRRSCCWMRPPPPWTGRAACRLSGRCWSGRI